MSDFINEDEFYGFGLTEDEQMKYVTKKIWEMNGADTADTDEKTIYGEVVGSSAKYIFVAPYSIYGEKIRIFNEQNSKWGIAAQRPGKDIRFVKGELTFNFNSVNNRKELYLDNVKELDSEKEFYNKLNALLRKRWQREGFRFHAKMYHKYDGEIAFEKWAAEETEAKLEEKYIAFIKEKAESREQDLKKIEDAIEQKNNELDEIKKDCSQEKQKLESLQKSNDMLEKRYLHYKELGIISENRQTDDYREIYTCASYEELAVQVWGYLWEKEKLYYEKSAVLSFMNALRTRQLILLWGRPGTGKTSLPKGVAKAVGARCEVIQIQSGWTDNQDILGFYNPVDKRYVSTQFLDAIVEAGKHTQRLYLILLDEMNLSNVEYYFSEMLNFFTKRPDEKYQLHLYSEKYKTDMMEDLDDAEFHGKDITEYKNRLKEMISHYPPVLEIPDNVRFIGTLNADETTKTISPKVIDRSCVIELQAISKKTKDDEMRSLPQQIALDGEKTAGRAVFDIKTADIADDAPVRLLIDKIREIFEEEDVPSLLSNRVYSYIDQWFGWEDDAVSEDEVILEKFLPLLDMENTEKNKRILRKIKREALDETQHARSWKKLSVMEKRAEDRIDRIMYWEN